MTGTPYISVLLPTFRQAETLLLTLRDLQHQDYPADRWELVLLDDGSRDVSGQLALACLTFEIEVTVRRVRGSLRYSHAALFNELLRLADPSSQAFVHVEDVRIQPDFLRQHAKWHTGECCWLVTGPMCEGPTETFAPTACQRWELMRMSGAESDVYRCCFQAVYAKSMSYPASLRSALTESGARGPFDDGMTGWGYHETEFAFRAALAGAMSVYDVRCGVYHPPHQPRDEFGYRGIDRTGAQEQGSARNIQYLCQKHGMACLPDWEIGVPVTSPAAMVGADAVISP